MSQRNPSLASNSRPDLLRDKLGVDPIVDCVTYEEPTTHFHRGNILSGVLRGECSYEQVKVYSDLSPGDDGTAIEYDPEFDSRLDKFDAVELGFEYAENERRRQEESLSEEKK